MKATNNTFVDFKVTRTKIPDKFKTKPDRFESYIWESQDGRLTAIKDFDDWHLLNTYNMLVNTILFAREISKHKALTSQMRRLVTACNYHLHYIGYELYLREYPNGENRYKSNSQEDSKGIPQSADRRNEDWS